jgi:hypothetical protein
MDLKNARRRPQRFDPTIVKRVFLVSAILGEGEEFYSLFAEAKGHPVHVMSGRSLEIVLGELDTIADFVDYLKAKEELLANKRTKVAILGGEEELLAFYLMNGRTFAPMFDKDRVIIEEGMWKGFTKSETFLSKKSADRISYGWDRLIDTAHTMPEEHYEKIAREMARPNRFVRRMIADAFYQAHRKAEAIGETKGRLFRRAAVIGDTTYVFLFWDPEDTVEERRDNLTMTMVVARDLYPQNKKVVGVSMTFGDRPKSWDFAAFYSETWTEEDHAEAVKLREGLGIFKQLEEIRDSAHEYPGPADVEIPPSP